MAFHVSQFFQRKRKITFCLGTLARIRTSARAVTELTILVLIVRNSSSGLDQNEEVEGKSKGCRNDQQATVTTIGKVTTAV